MSILNSINLTNVNQVIVTSSKTNANRSYGRRFTVSDGTTTQDVVLKDLFKEAPKLARKASTTEELEKIEGFIIQLEDADEISQLSSEIFMRQPWGDDELTQKSLVENPNGI